MRDTIINMKQPLVIYWSRRDFRIHDNPALTRAIDIAQEKKIDFLPLFILEKYMTRGDAVDQFGYPSRVFLTRAIPAFAKQFKTFAVIHGIAPQVLYELSIQFDLTICVNEDVHPDFYTQYKKLIALGITVIMVKDKMTVARDTKTGTGNLYSVFTPFKKSVWKDFVSLAPLPVAKVDLPEYFDVTTIEEANFKLVKPNEADLLSAMSTKRILTAENATYDINSFYTELPTYNEWYFDEESATGIFKEFVKSKLDTYKSDRDTLSIDGTSKMSVGLTWGLISARTMVKMIQDQYKQTFDSHEISGFDGPVHFISELIWREFYTYLFFHNPSLMNQEFQQKFRGTIQWAPDQTAHERFLLWMKGETGYPIVDAAMKQLAYTGWMHNRARMIVASVLTKNLGVDWRWGQEYFRAMLIDLDEASNNGGWQWGASVGADPKPIRIFNPYLQAENYDSQDEYQTTWLGKDRILNPLVPVVEHKTAREDALRRYGLSIEKDGTPRDF